MQNNAVELTELNSVF